MATEPTIFLVIEDEPTRNALGKLLKPMKFRCETFASGLEFLDSWYGASPGCLITELRMMSITGLQLLRRLVSNGSVLPVIVVTADAKVPMAV